MKTASLCALVGVFVAGCGGGDGGNGTSNGASANRPPPPAAQQLSQYIGTWTSRCQYNEIETIVVTRTPGTDDSIDLASKSDYFSAADCTGPLLATSTNTGNVTSKFIATTDSAVAFSPSSAGVMTKLDQVTTSIAQASTVLTGSGIYHTVFYGTPEVCVDFGNGSSSCTFDGLQPARSGIAEGLLLQGGTFYVLVPGGSGYTVDLQYTKKTG